MRKLEDLHQCSKLTKDERQLLSKLGSPSLFSSNLDIGLDYKLGVEVTDIPQSKVLLHTDEDFRNYLSAISNSYPSKYEELVQSSDLFLKYLTTKKHAKEPMLKTSVLALDCDDAKYAIRNQADIFIECFYIGSCEGLTLTLNTYEAQKIKVKNIFFIKEEFEQHVWYLTELIWKNIQSIARFNNALRLISNDDESRQCVIYGIMQFFKQKRRLPYNNKEDLKVIWRHISEHYPAHEEKDTVKTPDGIFSYGEIWKRYDATYSKHLLAYLVGDPIEKNSLFIERFGKGLV